MIFLVGGGPLIGRDNVYRPRRPIAPLPNVARPRETFGQLVHIKISLNTPTQHRAIASKDDSMTNLAHRLVIQPDPLTITVDISPAELIDKIAILEIKSERIEDPAKRANVQDELHLLKRAHDRAIGRLPELDRHANDLRVVNERLWVVEDSIRACERARDFGLAFIELARSVYRLNDRRAKIKRAINERLGSRLVEEKSYATYD
jgi:hypothetical protein